MIVERVNAGLARAKAKGTKLGRKPVKASVARFRLVFPPVTIDGEIYLDGGIVSNSPLAYADAKKP